MRLLLDTHLLIWAANGTVPASAGRLIEDPENQLFFSVVSLWEIAIKRGQNRPGFRIDPRIMRHGLLGNGYRELTIECEHAFAVEMLPPIHRDPFDRLLIAQASVEGITLLANDGLVARYPGPVLQP